MKFKLFLLFFSAFCIFGCKSPTKPHITDNKTYKFASLYEVKPGNRKTYPLDSLTNFNVNSVQIFRTDSVTYLTFLNKQFNLIYFYDLNTARYKFKIKLSVSGPNAVGPLVNNYFIRSIDSIYVISRYALSVVDRNGKLLSKKNFLNNPPEGKTALPQVYDYTPIIFRGDTLYISCTPDIKANDASNFTGKQCMMKYNSKTGDVNYEYEYPDIYRYGVFGPNYMLFYHAYNQAKKQIVFSFPAENNLFVAGGSKLTPRYAGSKMLDSIKPMPKAMDDFESYTRFFLQSPSYGPVYFDPYKRLYYRFAFRPISDADYKSRKWWKSKQLIILDENFKKVGESSLPDEVSYLSCFVTEKGFFAVSNDVKDEQHLGVQELIINKL